jgi:hypothetical protein
LEQIQPISTLKIFIYKKYSFQKRTQFSQENNALDVPVSNSDGYPWRDTWVSSTLLNRPIWKKMRISPA